MSNLLQLDLDLSDLLDVGLSSLAIYRESICSTFWKWTLFPESTEVFYDERNEKLLPNSKNGEFMSIILRVLLTLMKVVEFPFYLFVVANRS